MVEEVGRKNSRTRVKRRWEEEVCGGGGEGERRIRKGGAKRVEGAER